MTLSTLLTPTLRWVGFFRGCIYVIQNIVSMEIINLRTLSNLSHAWVGLGAPEATLSSETVEYAVVFFGGYMTKTVNEEDRSLLPLTRSSSENVYTAISGLEPRDAENKLRNPQFRCIITAKLRKETELLFSSISEGLPERLIGMMVYSLVSDIDVQSRLGVALDSESSVIMADDLRKEAENFLSSIVLNVPEKGIGVAPQDWFDQVGAKTNFSISPLLRYHDLPYPSVSPLAPVTPCPRLPRIGRLGAARRGPLLNPYSLWGGECNLG